MNLTNRGTISLLSMFLTLASLTSASGQALEPVNEKVLKANIEAAEATLAASRGKLKQADEKLAKFQELYKREVISRREFEQVEIEARLARSEVARDEARLEAARKDLSTAIEIAAARLEIEALNSHFRSGVVSRFRGSDSLSEQRVRELQSAFEKQFHEALPISARGQTPAHDRLGLDHQNKVDLGLSPSGREGTWLTNYLRSRGISYIAFDSRLAGSSTGAHIHIGSASPRKTAHPQSAPQAATKPAVKK